MMGMDVLSEYKTKNVKGEKKCFELFNFGEMTTLARFSLLNFTLTFQHVMNIIELPFNS